MAQRMTFGLFSGAASQRIEFVRMKGPRGTIGNVFVLQNNKSLSLCASFRPNSATLFRTFQGRGTRRWLWRSRRVRGLRHRPRSPATAPPIPCGTPTGTTPRSCFCIGINEGCPTRARIWTISCAAGGGRSRIRPRPRQGRRTKVWTRWRTGWTKSKQETSVTVTRKSLKYPPIGSTSESMAKPLRDGKSRKTKDEFSLHSLSHFSPSSRSLLCLRPSESTVHAVVLSYISVYSAHFSSLDSLGRLDPPSWFSDLILHDFKFYSQVYILYLLVGNRSFLIFCSRLLGVFYAGFFRKISTMEAPGSCMLPTIYIYIYSFFFGIFTFFAQMVAKMDIILAANLY